MTEESTMIDDGSRLEECIPTVHMVGDSTMADKCLLNGNPERGWGQLLPRYFVESVRVANHARDGRSSRSFLEEGHWGRALAAMQSGDWVVIQFGHNDQKEDRPELFADLDLYARCLAKMVDEARERGANPILATSICRRKFSEDGRLIATLGEYPQATRDVAERSQVPLADLNAWTRLYIEMLGPEASKALFLHFSHGESSFYPEGKADDTHLSENGALAVASYFAAFLRVQAAPLAHWLKV